MSKFWYAMRNYSAIAAALCSAFNILTVEKALIWLSVTTTAFVLCAIYSNYKAEKAASDEKIAEYIEHVQELEALSQQADIEFSRLKLFREYERTGGKS